MAVLSLRLYRGPVETFVEFSLSFFYSGGAATKEFMLIVASLLIVGLFVGLLSSIFGLGAGVIMMPAFLFLFPSLSQQTIIASSLLVIVANSGANIFHFSRSNFKGRALVFIPLIAAACGGIFLGGFLSSFTSVAMMKLVFAVAITPTAVLMWRVRIPNPSGQGKNHLPVVNYLQLKVGTSGFLGGLVSGLTGLGGGSMMVPLLTRFLHLSPPQVSLYSNTTMAATSLLGCVSFSFMSPPPLGEGGPFPSLSGGAIEPGPFLLGDGGGPVDLSFWGLDCSKGAASDSSKGHVSHSYVACC